MQAALQIVSRPPPAPKIWDGPIPSELGGSGRRTRYAKISRVEVALA